ncbi:hypothetical protein HRM2_21030 [Desulforapulum autotrophicum HRM2]|uniref:Uncharacterized protein n=1 Tax=Desulforapulum autotrophicum (strain ATCC 43914 / DSM 3382 / VKM B-1955 / HRM2) TaxID=177437 RepID=C0QDD7_DESAH|nr:hypothetical protein [Desulforapulum autotrophicum]ACN15201.1 hypothetical protein HRM2_21030 [Desulforapulum autotrophicum HRM2]
MSVFRAWGFVHGIWLLIWEILARYDDAITGKVLIGRGNALPGRQREAFPWNRSFNGMVSFFFLQMQKIYSLSSGLQKCLEPLKKERFKKPLLLI